MGCCRWTSYGCSVHLRCNVIRNNDSFRVKKLSCQCRVPCGRSVREVGDQGWPAEKFHDPYVFPVTLARRLRGWDPSPRGSPRAIRV